MNKFLLNHFEKLIFAVVVIICLFLIIGNVQKFMENKKGVTEHGKLKDEIEKELGASTPPPGLEEVGDYAAALNQKIAGSLVLDVPDYRAGTVYTPSLQLPPPIPQREVLVLMPPKINTEEESNNVTVKPGRHLVNLAFENDDAVVGEVVNNFPREHPKNPNYQGHRGAVFGAVLQRKLVHDGKADVSAENPWLVLTGSKDKPEWKALKNPLETTYILAGDRDFQTRQPEVPRGLDGEMDGRGGEGEFDMDRGFDPRDMRMQPRGGRRDREAGARIAMLFEHEDLHQRGFQTFAYRMAIVGAVQEGIRVFLKPRTQLEIDADEQARRDRNPPGYASGIDFFSNPQISTAMLKRYGVTTGGDGRRFRAPAAAPAESTLYYMVISDWSPEYKAKVDTDSEIILSGMFGEQVSIFVLKHIRYEYEVKLAAGPEGMGPMPDREVDGPKRMATATASVIVSFTHSAGQRIGHEPARPERWVQGRHFIDGQRRQVNFDTPYILDSMGKSARNFKVKKTVTDIDENGKPVQRVVWVERVENDVPFIQVKNMFTDEITQYWREGGDVITRIRRLAGEAMARQKKINEAKAAKRGKRPPRPERPEEPERRGPGGETERMPVRGGGDDERAPRGPGE